MASYRQELKKIENRNKANEQLGDLINALKNVDKSIEDLKRDAEEQLLNDNEAGFELVASSIFYFQDVRNVIQTVKIQFQTYIKTAEVMDTIEGVRPVLKNIANNMNSYPSMNKSNKDFMKFKKSLLRGQLNMKAMTSMMTSINPATTTTRSKEEMNSLKQSILIKNGMNPNLNVQTGKITENDDFFNAINK